MKRLPVRPPTHIRLIARAARSAALACVLLIAPLNGGCTCHYPAAERGRTLSEPIDPQRVQAVLRTTPGITTVSDPHYAGTRRLFYVFPVRRDVYHNFRWDEELFGHVKHAEGGRTLRLQAYTRNHRPDEQTRRHARHLLDELQSGLIDAVPVAVDAGDTTSDRFRSNDPGRSGR